jgi:hypothetical protein
LRRQLPGKQLVGITVLDDSTMRAMLKSDLAKLEQLADEQIDFSDIPPLTDEQLSKMQPLREVILQAVSNKVRITIRLDAVIHRSEIEKIRVHP